MEVTQMTIEISEYKEARKALLGGTAPVMAHRKDSVNVDNWFRAVEVKAARGTFLARSIHVPETWVQIDGLEVRK
jgi:hypothetical protein